MRFNASQLQKILDENVNDYGANKLIEFVFNSLMKLERQAFMAENKSSNNKGNGYRSRCFSSLSKQKNSGATTQISDRRRQRSLF